MLTLSTLEREQTEPSQTSPARVPAAWGWGHGLALAGATIALLAGGAAVYLYAQRPRLPRIGDTLSRVQTYVDRLSPVDSWQLWQSLLEDGLERRRSADEPAYAEARLRYRLAIGAALIVAAGGAALVVLGLRLSVRRKPASTSLSGSQGMSRGV